MSIEDDEPTTENDLQAIAEADEAIVPVLKASADELAYSIQEQISKFCSENRLELKDLLECIKDIDKLFEYFKCSHDNPTNLHGVLVPSKWCQKCGSLLFQGKWIPSDNFPRPKMSLQVDSGWLLVKKTK